MRGHEFFTRGVKYVPHAPPYKLRAIGLLNAL